MNGSVRSPTGAVDIRLKRGRAGLGFNIVGGVDQEYVMNDSGIYVSKIKEDGAAGLDGRLQEGDKILAINEVELDNLTHKAVVELFREAGEDVALRVMKKLPCERNGSSDSNPDSRFPASYLVGIMAGLVGAAAIVTIICKRRFR